MAANAPLEANSPSSRAKACSIRTGGERFQLIFLKFTNPYSSRAFLLIIIVIIDFSFRECVGNSNVYVYFLHGTSNAFSLPIVSLPNLSQQCKPNGMQVILSIPVRQDSVRGNLDTSDTSDTSDRVSPRVASSRG